MSKLDRIATFIMVIEQNGFAAAARVKGISTPAVSRQIATLEKELATELLHRTTRKIALTEVGNEYYQQCKKTLAELNEAEGAIAKSKTEATGTLTIMANRYFAITHILPRLMAFMQQNSKLHINFKLAEKFPDFKNEEIDILFGVSIQGSDELVSKRVATTRYILCASPQYLKKFGTPKTPQDLIQHRYITHSIRKPNNIIHFQDLNVPINPILSLNDSYAMLECALQNIGIVNLHDYMVQDAISSGSLIEILGEYQEKQKSIYLYYQQTRYLQPKIRKFIDFFTIFPD